MRLFLASQDLGNFAEVLQQLVGAKRRALVLSNARDYYNDEARIASSVEKTLINLGKIGIEAERLDLKPYFGKQSTLASLIDQKQPGLIFSIGGNVICLATALHASGLDEIIRKGVAENNFVYGGYSAGAMVATHDLTPYRLSTPSDKPLHPSAIFDTTRAVYHLAPYTQGLGLIPQYIAPHMDRADHIDAMNERITNIKQTGAEAILLSDADVFVVNNGNGQILRGNTHGD